MSIDSTHKKDQFLYAYLENSIFVYFPMNLRELLSPVIIELEFALACDKQNLNSLGGEVEKP